jgi:hypothetical protein
MIGGTEQFRDGWNYGGFVTVSGPAVGIPTTNLSGGDTTIDGTSFSSPLVAALVSLIKSLQPQITSGSYASEIATILENSTDKVDSSRHPYPNGRNDYLGYGRVNAYKALLYTLQHYSTTLGGNGTTITLHENISVASGTTMTILPGTTIKFDPGVSLSVNGSLGASGGPSQPIVFDRSGTSGSWTKNPYQLSPVGILL